MLLSVRPISTSVNSSSSNLCLSGLDLLDLDEAPEDVYFVLLK